MSAVLGYKNDIYIGYFSDVTVARDDGCDMMTPVTDEFIGEKGLIYYVLMSVYTFFDDQIDFVTLVHNRKEAMSKMQELISDGNLEKIADEYWNGYLSDEQKGDRYINGSEDIIRDIKLTNGAAYPYE